MSVVAVNRTGRIFLVSCHIVRLMKGSNCGFILSSISEIEMGGGRGRCVMYFFMNKTKALITNTSVIVINEGSNISMVGSHYQLSRAGLIT